MQVGKGLLVHSDIDMISELLRENILVHRHVRIAGPEQRQFSVTYIRYVRRLWFVVVPWEVPFKVVT